VISLHGRNKIIVGNIVYNQYTFVLTGSDHNASDILKELKDMGLGSIKVTVGEFLSMEQERLITGTVQDLESYSFDNLSVMLFEDKHPAQKDRPLFDDELIRGKTPMTKQEVRWASINYLSLMPEDVVFDIGAGTGSVSIEMARKAYNGVVYSIERNEEAYALLNRNREKLFAYNMIPLYGDAMEHLPTLPVPDKAFIGGTGKQMKKILDYLFLLNPHIRLVINVIALETLSEALSLLKEHNCRIEVSCINVARNKPAGDYNLMVSNNPVYIITAKRASD